MSAISPCCTSASTFLFLDLSTLSRYVHGKHPQLVPSTLKARNGNCAVFFAHYKRPDAVAVRRAAEQEVGSTADHSLAEVFLTINLCSVSPHSCCNWRPLHVQSLCLPGKPPEWLWFVSPRTQPSEVSTGIERISVFTHVNQKKEKSNKAYVFEHKSDREGEALLRRAESYEVRV